jgi:hypothetical protein
MVKNQATAGPCGRDDRAVPRRRLVCWWAEANGNPIHQQLGVAAADGNMEGKEVRFGIFNSALFATITTDASCGAVNSMHDSFTALGGLVPLFNISSARSSSAASAPDFTACSSSSCSPCSSPD